MQVLTVSTRQFIYSPTQLMRHISYHCMSIVIICLYKTRNLRKVHFLAFRESLHGIKYTIMDCHPFKDVHIHRTGSMQEDLGFLPLAKPWQQFTQNRVFNGNNIQIGIRTHLFYIRYGCSTSNLSQGSCRLHGSTEHLHDIMTGSQKRLPQVGGQITSPYQNYLHDLPSII